MPSSRGSSQSRIELMSLMSPALLADSLPLNHQSELGTVDYYNFGGFPIFYIYVKNTRCGWSSLVIQL